MADMHCLRFAVDVIIKGPKLSPTAMRRVAQNISTHAHVLAFEDVKNVEVTFPPADERVVYAHYHEAGGEICQLENGCWEQAQDGFGQDIEE